MYASGTGNILNGQADIYKTQNQLSTGRRILTPRDNPVDSTLALMTTQAKDVNATFLKNQGTASDRLGYIDTQLGAVSDLLQDVVSRSVQGGNGTYSSQQKQAIAEELKRRFEGLVDIANTKDGSGEYVFSGNTTNVKPFNVDGSGGNYSLAGGGVVSYVGDDGQRMLQVEAARTVATSESGKEVFMRVTNSDGSLNGRSVFDSLKNMIDLLDSSSGVNPAPSYNQALGDLHAALDHVTRIRASVGSRINQMDSLTNAGGDVSVQLESQLAKLDGLDYAEAISRLNQQQMQLQAAQQSFVKVSELSLFSFIS
jgi:flagellar hook-associated protein 3 FlgL